MRKPIDIDHIEVTPEFREALDLLESSRGHFFVTGKAGTGKSTLLQYFRATTGKRLAVAAPTGVAAVNVEGQTLHSFFRFPLHFIEKEHVHRAGRNRKVIEQIDALVIDEVSMVRADVMDAVDTALRLNRDKPGLPFGGVQMLLFGDLLQLPPVVDRELGQVFGRRYRSPYFFDAHVFGKIEMKRIELTKVFRQTGDPAFVGLLDKMRDGGLEPEDLERINGRVDRNGGARPGWIVLTTRNNDAAAVNEGQLEELPAEAWAYDAVATGKFDEASYPTDPTVVLKKGAQVMLIKNDPGRRWVNGDIGRVEELFDDSIRVSIRGEEHEVPRARWEKYEYAYDTGTDRIEKKVVGTFEQLPVKLAWAITIHKSQGQTFDNVVIEMGSGAFAHGQAYVALSRCTRLDGIVLRRPLKAADVILDRCVLDFCRGERRTEDGELNEGF